ncbi:LAFA_0C05336g1_1 [Lachancea sp. 'fantastica']|nr:LAFA_0C05336g1_1 [Lachancea sp. 'fantastica']
MSLGVSLSQLIVEQPEPFLSGYEALDQVLKGFQPKCIYEVFGLPGMGIAEIGTNLAKGALQTNRSTLWIDAHHTTPLYDLEGLDHVKFDKFTQYVFYFQQLAEQSRGEIYEQERKYELIVIRGLSKVVSSYLHSTSSSQAIDSVHQFKNKSLITLFTAMTKYAQRYKTAIVMFNDAMNTGYTTSGSHNNSNESWTAQFQSYTEESPFLVRSSKRKAVQVLRSALVANLGVGSKDQVWEVFLKRRIGIFLEWDRSRPWNRVPSKHRIAMVQDLSIGPDGDVIVPLMHDNKSPIKQLDAKTHVSQGQVLPGEPCAQQNGGAQNAKEPEGPDAVSDREKQNTTQARPSSGHEDSYSSFFSQEAKRSRLSPNEWSTLPFTPRLTDLHEAADKEETPKDTAVLYDSEGEGEGEAV